MATIPQAPQQHTLLIRRGVPGSSYWWPAVTDDSGTGAAQDLLDTFPKMADELERTVISEPLNIQGCDGEFRLRLMEGGL